MVTPAIKKCHRALLNLGYRYPHFLMVHAKIRDLYREDPSIETANIDSSGSIRVNPTFIDSLSNAELGGVVAHELLHLRLGHHDRKGTRDHQIWNLATDMAINHALKTDQIQLPKWVVYPPSAYTGPMVAEPIYEWLLEQADKEAREGGDEGEKGSGSMPGGSGQPGKPGQGQPKVGAGCGVEPAPGEGQATQGAQGPAEDWDQVWEQARQIGIQAGHGSSAVVTLLNPRPSRTDWRRIIGHGYQVVSTRSDKVSQTYSRRSRRSPVSGPQFAGWQSGDPRIAIVIDVSGSMSREWVEDIVGHVLKMGEVYKNTKAFLVTHTEYVCWQGWVKPSAKQAIVASCQFSGGTNAKPAYEACAKAGKFDATIHFTDCELPGAWPSAAFSRRLIIGAYGPGADDPYCEPPPGSVVIPCLRDR
jgi:predicted metal-dependent peptidase